MCSFMAVVLSSGGDHVGEEAKNVCSFMAVLLSSGGDPVRLKDC